MKTKRTIIIALALFILFAAFITVLYKDAIFQRGNPLPYISKMISMNDDNPFARVFKDRDVYIIKNSHAERYGSGALVESIENAYDVTFGERMGGNAFFYSDEITIVADIEVYWKFYEVWELEFFDPNTVYIPPEKDKEAPAPVTAEELIKSIQDTGMSSGEIKFTGTMTNVNGDEQKQYEDDKYQYTVSLDTVISVGGILKNLEGIAYGDGSMSETEMTEYGKFFAQKLYPFMDWGSGAVNISATPSATDGENVYQMTFIIEERSGNVLLSTNTFDINNEGTVILFTRTQNDPGLFNLDSHLGPDEARQIAFEEAMRHKEEMEALTGNALPGETIADFEFGRVEQCMPENKKVAWVVEIKPATSWGSMNEIDDYTLRIGIDAETGEVLMREVTTGN